MYDWVGISQRRVKKAAKQQEKDLRKVREYRDRIEWRQSWDEKDQRLAQAYNRRDQRRIDRLVDRIAARAGEFAGAPDFPNGIVADDGAPRKADGDALAQAAAALRDVRDVLKGDNQKAKEVT